MTTYFWSSLECELCKIQYPYEIEASDGSHMLQIIEYDLPKQIMNIDPQYLVLESISTSVSKVIHVINMLGLTQFFLGRGTEADVRVTDISVSRLHASIFKSPLGHFYLCDNDSKFGTLVQVRTPIKLPKNDATWIQAGRSLLRFQIQGSLLDKI